MESPSEGRLIILIFYLFFQQVTLFAGEKKIFTACRIISSPAGEGLPYIQQPGSPLCPQQLLRFFILRKVFLIR
jgi:hypothetical protein